MAAERRLRWVAVKMGYQGTAVCNDGGRRPWGGMEDVGRPQNPAGFQSLFLLLLSFHPGFYSHSCNNYPFL